MLRKGVEMALVNRLYSGAQPIADVVREISSSLRVSVQAVYKAIGKLRTEEVVITHSKQIALSGVWIDKEKTRLEFADNTYRAAADLRTLIEKESGRVTSVFKNLSEVDLYWAHAYFQLAEHVDLSVPTYSIQPHDWYPYVRQETDAYWIKQHREAGRMSRTLITHPSPLDQKVMRERKRELGVLFEFTLGENPLKQNSATYYNLLSPYIIKVRLESSVATVLNNLIATHDTLPLSFETNKEIQVIVQTRGRFVFTIEKYPDKAKRIERKVKRFFAF